jgi:hypothetical protein
MYLRVGRTRKETFCLTFRLRSNIDNASLLFPRGKCLRRQRRVYLSSTSPKSVSLFHVYGSRNPLSNLNPDPPSCFHALPIRGPHQQQVTPPYSRSQQTLSISTEDQAIKQHLQLSFDDDDSGSWPRERA